LTRFQSTWPPVATNFPHPTRVGTRQRATPNLGGSVRLRKIRSVRDPLRSHFGPAHRNNITPTVPATIAGWVIGDPRLTTPKQAPSNHQAFDCWYWLPCQLTSPTSSGLGSQPQTPGNSPLRSYASAKAQCYITQLRLHITLPQPDGARLHWATPGSRNSSATAGLRRDDTSHFCTCAHAKSVS
jgi:hypothetical protein